MEIKFRAWDKRKRIMVYQNENNSADYWDGVHASEIELVNSILRDSSYEFMQYTGLKDKNGREIYEGDILELGIQKGILKSVVEYHSPTFCHRWINLEEAGIRGKKIEPLFWNTNIIFEVIGNVYENPELLEGAK